MEYRYVKVSFQSLVLWTTESNILRCNPNFNKKPRYDYILITTPTHQTYFAQLIFLFTTTTDGSISPWALVQPFDAPVPKPTTHEKDLELFRIRQRPRTSSVFISAKWIMRGVLILPSYEKDGDYYVFDVLDEDLFLHMREMWKARLSK